MNWRNVLPIGIAQLNRVMPCHRTVEPLGEGSVGSGILTVVGDHHVLGAVLSSCSDIV